MDMQPKGFVAELRGSMIERFEKLESLHAMAQHSDLSVGGSDEEGSKPDAVSPALDEKIQLIKTVFVQLKEFSSRYTLFFYNGFLGPAPYLDRSTFYSPEYVDGIIWKRIGEDLDVLISALLQRLLVTSPEAEESSPSSQSDTYITDGFTVTLQNADRFADHILSLAHESGLVDDARAITYFHSSLTSRVVPYSRAALIGMPYSAVSRSSSPHNRFIHDILAIPHEVGHYIYWNSAKHDNMRLPEALKLEPAIAKQPPWLLNWLEEIFSDTFACATAGAASVLNFQNYLLRGTRDEYVYDDGIHPPPILRGFIQCHTLEQIGAQRVANRLTDHWNTRMQQAGAPTRFHPHGHPDITLDVNRVREQIEEVVGVILGTSTGTSGFLAKYLELLPEIPHLGSLIQNVTTDDWTAIHEGIYQDWQDYFKDIPTHPSEKPGITSVPNTWIDHIINRYVSTDEEKGTSSACTPEELWEAESLPVDVWMAILHAGGWATGPGGPGNIH